MPPEELEKFLDELIENHSAAILAAIAVVEARAITQLDTIEVRQDGNIVGPSKALPQAKAASKAIQQDLSGRMQSKYNSAIRDLSKIDRAIRHIYGQRINNTNANALIAASKTVFDDYNSITLDTSNRLNKAIIDYSVAGLSREELKTQVRGILTGDDDVRGVPMNVRAEQFTQDSIMRYHNRANMLVADQVGIKKFKYYGNVMATTRPFCAGHAGDVKTRDEWEQIGQNQTWKGKSSSNIFVDVGGYNCRHFLTPSFS